MPANPPRKTRVDVLLKSVDLFSQEADFVLKPVGPDPLPPPTGPNQTLTFHNKDQNGVGHDGLRIDFITDDTKQGYAFPPNIKRAEAVSSQLGATDLCPPQGEE